MMMKIFSWGSGSRTTWDSVRAFSRAMLGSNAARFTSGTRAQLDDGNLASELKGRSHPVPAHSLEIEDDRRSCVFFNSLADLKPALVPFNSAALAMNAIAMSTMVAGPAPMSFLKRMVEQSMSSL